MWHLVLILILAWIAMATTSAASSLSRMMQIYEKEMLSIRAAQSSIAMAERPTDG